jgi:hypothetical protein
VPFLSPVRLVVILIAAVVVSFIAQDTPHEDRRFST